MEFVRVIISEKVGRFSGLKATHEVNNAARALSVFFGGSGFIVPLIISYAT